MTLTTQKSYQVCFKIIHSKIIAYRIPQIFSVPKVVYLLFIDTFISDH